MTAKKIINPAMATALVLLIGLLVSGCQTVMPVFEDLNISYETAMSHLESLDKGGRWLSQGIKEINEIEELSEDERILINHHLFGLIKDEDQRFDGESLGAFAAQLEEMEIAEEAIAVIERTHIRVRSPLNLHDGYWVATMKPEGSLIKLKIINDMHIDTATNRVTVYAQSRMMGRVVAPAQISPGEVTEMPNGDRVASHPDAVYLNGSGQELTEDDGTGSWWVKHSWILGGEGYFNAELKPQEYYEEAYVEGNMTADGVTMKVGDPAEQWGYNLRKPVLTGNSTTYLVQRFEYRDDGSIEEGFVIEWKHKNEKSPFNGLARREPDARLWSQVQEQGYVD